MRIVKRILCGILIFGLMIVSVFLIGRYGWKLRGFEACQRAGITELSVKEGEVHITGFYPGSFPEGFLGYYAEEKDGILYVGYRFSAIFGIFETGDFDITIPTQGEIRQIYTKSGMNEELIWSAEGKRPWTEEYGVFVRLDSKDVYLIDISFENQNDVMQAADSFVFESGEFFYADTGIEQIAKEKNAPVDFTVQVKTTKGEIFATGDFTYDNADTQIFLCVTEDGRIVEQTGSEPDLDDTVPVTVEGLTGPWNLAEKENDDAVVNEMFPGAMEFGSSMEITSDGRISWYIGADGGSGIYSLSRNVLHAEMTNDFDNTAMTVEFTAEKKDGQLLLVMDYKNMYLYWSQGEGETGKGE
ncbi:MAG: hypothetical protein J6B06_03435 [Lachnospiraceae bacterium]|nr:hypothetical protein [Lachnospiraceae bacterium]